MTLTPELLTPETIMQATRHLTTPQNSVDATRGDRPKEFIPTIASIWRTLGEEKAADVLRLQLAWFNTQANATHPLSEAQIDMMAPFILEHMMQAAISFNLADIKIIFQRAAAGYYGKLYGGIGTMEICQWIDAYEQEKIDAIDRWEGQHRDPDPYERMAGDDGRSIQHAAMVWYQQMQNNKNDKQ